MVEHDRGDEEAPDQHLPAVRAPGRDEALEQGAQAEQGCGEHGGDHPVEPVEEAQLAVPDPVADVALVREEARTGHEPSHVAHPESLETRRVVVGMLI